MDDILRLCIRVDGVPLYYDDFYGEESRIEYDPSMAKKYGWNNGVVAFATEDGAYYVTPFCIEVADMLEELGYEEGGLYVPFSNGEIPNDPQMAERWQELMEAADRLHEERRLEYQRERYRGYAEEKRLRELPEEAYQMALEIPQDGLVTRWMGQEPTTTRPIQDWQMHECMGTFYQNNGRVSFVDSQGRMYVSPFCKEIKEMLRAAGYQERSLFVPLSNGEEIIDPAVATRWDEMCTEADRIFDEREAKRRAERYQEMASQRGLTDLPEELYKISLEIPEEGLVTRWMGQEPATTRPIQDWQIDDCMGIYCQNNGRVAFVDASGKTYVTPFCEDAIRMLRAAGYHSGSLGVPLSNGETIVNSEIAATWDVLCTEADRIFYERSAQRRQERYRKMADHKHLGELPTEAYDISMEVPEEGLETTWIGQEQATVRPVYEWQMEDHMGTYCQNNGRVVFVDASGKTYVTPFCQKIQKMLREAGYQSGSLYVPLSNGEDLLDPELAARWSELCQREREEQFSGGSFTN